MCAQQYLQEILAYQQKGYGRVIAIRHEIIAAGLQATLQAGYTFTLTQLQHLARGLWPAGFPYNQETFTLLQTYRPEISGLHRENITLCTWSMQ